MVRKGANEDKYHFDNREPSRKATIHEDLLGEEMKTGGVTPYSSIPRKDQFH